MASILENILYASSVQEAADTKGVPDSKVKSIIEKLGPDASEASVVDAINNTDAPVGPSTRPVEQAAEAVYEGAVKPAAEGVKAAGGAIARTGTRFLDELESADKKFKQDYMTPTPEVKHPVSFADKQKLTDIAIAATPDLATRYDMRSDVPAKPAPTPIASSPVETAVAKEVVKREQKQPGYTGSAINSLEGQEKMLPKGSPLAEQFAEAWRTLKTEYDANKDRLAVAEIAETFARGIAQMATGLHQFKNKMPLEGVKFNPTDYDKKYANLNSDLRADFDALRQQYGLAENAEERQADLKYRAAQSAEQRRQYDESLAQQKQSAADLKAYRDEQLSIRREAAGVSYNKASGKDLDSQAAYIQKKRDSAVKGSKKLFDQLTTVYNDDKISDKGETMAEKITAATGIDISEARKMTKDPRWYVSDPGQPDVADKIKQFSDRLSTAPVYVSIDEEGKDGKKVRNVYPFKTIPDAKVFAKSHADKNAQFIDIGPQ